ncbi:unnamed protein product, partial [marine sediment metagenome]
MLGLAIILSYFGTLDYAQVFAMAHKIVGQTMSIFPGTVWSVPTIICILLFTGAMGKSAQMPLHVWLPASMEGPTPISALIHAATMVTAGVFMVARTSPLFELSSTALSVVLVIGATSALFTGLIAIVQNDIKRVIAYSTLSQLGYMMVGLGASAFAAGIFHLFTHAFFKALLFLAAGSVIIGMHHEQDMRQMGNLRKYMPITYLCFLLGSLSLAAIPPFAGYYSKDAIIEAVKLSSIPGATYAYYCVLAGAFVTALYIFRAFFLTFHTEERMDEHTRATLRESPWVVWLPLVILAVPSVILGAMMATPLLYQEHSWFGSAIYVAPQYNVLAQMAKEYGGWWPAMKDAIYHAPFWLAIAGVITAWLAYIVIPVLPLLFSRCFSWPYQVLMHKYGFDDFNQIVFVDGAQKLGDFFYRFTDLKIIDGIVNGAGQLTNRVSATVRRSQTGY